MRPTALLHAALQNLFARMNRAGERYTFVDAVRDRFFEKYIFARLESVDGHGDVPMVGGGDDYRIKVLVEHFTIVEVSGGETFRSLLDGIAAWPIHVAYGDNL